MRFSHLVALAASLSTSAAVYQGFNYGSTKSDGTFNYEADFKSLFQSAKGLTGASGFTSARLYTMIQGGSSTNEPTQAIQAAIDENVTLLLGLWGSGGQGPLSAEITALKSAIAQHGDAFAKLVAGISVGSEDLYRDSAIGKASNAGIGADAATISSYIDQVRTAIAGTSLKDVPVGHVDTWTAWVDSANKQAIDNCDFIGMDAYPYFQNTMANGIENGKSLFNSALDQTKAAVGSKPVWITETGWPVSGKTENLAVPSTANAKTYWDEVGCPNFGTVNTWWFTLQDSNPVTPNPSFGIIGSSYSTTPLYDLSCSAVTSSSSSSQSSGQSSTQASSSSSTTSTTGGSGSGSGSGSSGSASATSSGSSAASSAASGAAASSGDGLTPSEGAGNGIGPVSSPTTTGSTSYPTGSTGGNSSVPVGTATTGLKTSTTGSAAGTGASQVSTNAANVLSGAFVGGMGALLAAVAAL